jgi:hypothetical protein
MIAVKKRLHPSNEYVSKWVLQSQLLQAWKAHLPSLGLMSKTKRSQGNFEITYKPPKGLAAIIQELYETSCDLYQATDRLVIPS